MMLDKKYLRIVAGGIISGFLLVGVAQAQNGDNAKYQESMAALKGSKYPKLLSLTQAIATEDRNDPKNWYLMAIALFRLNHSENAITALNNAKLLDPSLNFAKNISNVSKLEEQINQDLIKKNVKSKNGVVSIDPIKDANELAQKAEVKTSAPQDTKNVKVATNKIVDNKKNNSINTDILPVKVASASASSVVSANDAASASTTSEVNSVGQTGSDKTNLMTIFLALGLISLVIYILFDKKIITKKMFEFDFKTKLDYLTKKISEKTKKKSLPESLPELVVESTPELVSEKVVNEELTLDVLPEQEVKSGPIQLDEVVKVADEVVQPIKIVDPVITKEEVKEYEQPIVDDIVYPEIVEFIEPIVKKVIQPVIEKTIEKNEPVDQSIAIDDLIKLNRDNIFVLMNLLELKNEKESALYVNLAKCMKLIEFECGKSKIDMNKIIANKTIINSLNKLEPRSLVVGKDDPEKLHKLAAKNALKMFKSNF